MAHRSKLFSPKHTKKEELELHIYTNPLLNSRSSILARDDYEAPATAHSLRPHSKWLLVRNNIHKIRSWGKIDDSKVDVRFRDWYLFLQMRRELRRAQEQISQIQDRPGFVPVRYFNLPIDENHVRRYSVSHIQPSDALYYPSCGPEPFVLQSLFYYFSRECAVPYDSVFRSFLSDVCSISNRKRQRIYRVEMFRRIALTMAIIVFVIIGLMFFILVIGVMKTTANLKLIAQNEFDPDFYLQQTQTIFETTSSYL